MNRSTVRYVLGDAPPAKPEQGSTTLIDSLRQENARLTLELAQANEALRLQQATLRAQHSIVCSAAEVLAQLEAAAYNGPEVIQ